MTEETKDYLEHIEELGTVKVEWKNEGSFIIADVFKAFYWNNKQIPKATVTMNKGSKAVILSVDSSTKVMTDEEAVAFLRDLAEKCQASDFAVFMRYFYPTVHAYLVSLAQKNRLMQVDKSKDHKLVINFMYPWPTADRSTVEVTYSQETDSLLPSDLVKTIQDMGRPGMEMYTRGKISLPPEFSLTYGVICADVYYNNPRIYVCSYIVDENGELDTVDLYNEQTVKCQWEEIKNKIQEQSGSTEFKIVTYNNGNFTVFSVWDTLVLDATRPATSDPALSVAPKDCKNCIETCFPATFAFLTGLPIDIYYCPKTKLYVTQKNSDSAIFTIQVSAENGKMFDMYFGDRDELALSFNDTENFDKFQKMLKEVLSPTETFDNDEDF